MSVVLYPYHSRLHSTSVGTSTYQINDSAYTSSTREGIIVAPTSRHIGLSSTLSSLYLELRLPYRERCCKNLVYPERTVGTRPFVPIQHVTVALPDIGSPYELDDNGFWLSVVAFSPAIEGKINLLLESPSKFLTALTGISK